MAKSLQIRLKTSEVFPFVPLELVASNRIYIIHERCTFVKIFLQKISVFSQNLKGPHICGITISNKLFR